LPKNYRMKDERWAWWRISWNQSGREIEVIVSATSRQQAKHKVFWNKVREDEKMEYPPKTRYSYYDFVVKEKGIISIMRVGPVAPERTKRQQKAKDQLTLKI